MKIKAERLYIREVVPEDWKSLLNIAQDFQKSPYVMYDYPFPTEEEELKEVTARLAASKLFYGVFLHDSPEMIGYVCFHYKNEVFEMGYCFHSAYHGKGYALESCQAAIWYIRRKYIVKTIKAGTAMKNEPSVKLLKKLGFILTGTEPVSFYKDENGEDIFFEGGNFLLLENGRKVTER